MQIKIYTSNDLDGAGSVIALKWVLGKDVSVDVSVSNIFKIQSEYNALVSSGRSDIYDEIFILNMIPSFKLTDNTTAFSKGMDLIDGEPIGTTTNLIIKSFLDNPFDLSDDQVRLIDTIDQFYEDGVYSKATMSLNGIFSYGRNKYGEFHKRFANGLYEYTEAENRIINSYISGMIKEYKNLEIAESIKTKGIYLVIVPDMKYKHELLDMIFKKKLPKMVFLVDPSEGLVSVRKAKTSKFDMSKLCTTLIDGRSLVNCAGGRFTEKFIDFTKSFI